jgi:hypothetical protein
LDVVEVCRPCVLWDCDGRTYAIDCYLKLLVRLCHIYDLRGGVKTIKAGASQDQILNETRLRNLQLQLIRDLREVMIHLIILIKIQTPLLCIQVPVECKTLRCEFIHYKLVGLFFLLDPSWFCVNKYLIHH